MTLRTTSCLDLKSNHPVIQCGRNTNMTANTLRQGSNTQVHQAFHRQEIILQRTHTLANPIYIQMSIFTAALFCPSKEHQPECSLLFSH